MALAVRALSGDVACLATLRNGLRGRVHSVFARVVNVIVPDGTLLTLASREVDDAPDTLVVDLRTFDGGGVAIGAPVAAYGGLLAVGRRLAIRVDGARPWVPLLPWYPIQDAPLRRSLDALRAYVAGLDRSPGGAAPPQSSAVAIAATARLAQHATALGRALELADLGTAQVQGEALVGLGQGLTPSGDDVLLGLFAVLHLPGGPCEPLRDLGRQIMARAAHRTHAISLCALRAAAEGRVRARVAALLSALIAGERETMLAALRAVLAIGSSSGRDIVAGIVLGFDAQLHHARVLRSAA
jgi:hypothetical protein